MGPDFWKPLERKIILGPEGLRLTVVKAGLKKPNSQTSFKEMSVFKNIPKDFKNFDKVRLQVRCYSKDGVQLDKKFSEIIADKVKYF